MPQVVVGVEGLVVVDHKDVKERRDDVVADAVAGVGNDRCHRWCQYRGMRGNRHLEEAVDADGPV